MRDSIEPWMPFYLNSFLFSKNPNFTFFLFPQICFLILLQIHKSLILLFKKLILFQSRLVFPSNFVGWCFKKSSRLHFLTVGRGSGPKVGVVALFSSSSRRASICCQWASSTTILVASICCITSYCCSSDAACRCIDASCCCIITVLCCVIAATIVSIALAISGTSP